MIPCIDPRAGVLAHLEAIEHAVHRVLVSGRYVLGDEVAAFEREFAARCEVPHAVGVGNATDALQIALRACGVGAGDEVITVAHTAVATVGAIEMAGATPVLVDIEPDCYTLDASKLSAAIGPRVRAVIPVHLYGQPADLDPILSIARDRRLVVIEDCSQAHGARYRGKPVGAWGDIGCFSFYPTKNLGAIGDGGMAVCRDPSLAETMRGLREYGWDDEREATRPGVNSRLDELQAAILRLKLGWLDEANAARAERALVYDQAFRPLDGLAPARREAATHAFHLYVVRSRHRAELRRRLLEAGVGTLVHYRLPVHLQRAYLGRLRGSEALPETERAAREVLSLPLYPELEIEDVRKVAAAVLEHVRAIDLDLNVGAPRD